MVRPKGATVPRNVDAPARYGDQGGQSFAELDARRDLLDHVIVVNERHLKRLMNEYVRFYHEDRTHLALAKGTPAGREVTDWTEAGSRIVAMPKLGGPHHRYHLVA